MEKVVANFDQNPAFVRCNVCGAKEDIPEDKSLTKLLEWIEEFKKKHQEC